MNTLWQQSTMPLATTNAIMAFAHELAFDAGAILREGFSRTKEIAHKNNRELVTSADIASEKFIRKRIEHFFPNHEVLSEELGATQKTDVENLWIVDPLDGTNNFAHGFPFFCVSIAFLHCGSLMCGVVFDPLRLELFSATSYDKAQLNNVEITVSDISELSQAIVGTGFPYDLCSNNENNLDNFLKISYLSQGIRRAGSAALDLCYVAAGRLDGFWELKLKPWDIAAGALIVNQAGGIVTTFTQEPWHILSDKIVAANGDISCQLIDAINS